MLSSKMKINENALLTSGWFLSKKRSLCGSINPSLKTKLHKLDIFLKYKSYK